MHDLELGRSLFVEIYSYFCRLVFCSAPGKYPCIYYPRSQNDHAKHMRSKSLTIYVSLMNTLASFQEPQIIARRRAPLAYV